MSNREVTVDPDVPLLAGGQSTRLVREERVLLIVADVGAQLAIAVVRGVELDRYVPLHRGGSL